MGQRTIDTILRVQKESEYKTALKSCSAELKVMKSELDRVSSEFRTNANSMEALTAKGDVLSRMYVAQEQKIDLLRSAMQQAQNTRDKEAEQVTTLRNQYEQAQRTLAEYAERFGETSDEYAQQKVDVDKLRDSIIQHQAKLDSSAKSYTYYSTQLNKAEVELDNLQDRQEQNNRLLEEARQSADGCATSIDRYGDAVREASDSTEKSASAVEALAGQMVASGIQEKVEDLAAKMMEASEAAQNYELAIAQVGTISDETILSQKDLSEGVLQLSKDLRKDADEVAAAAYEALSAGVDTANMLDFTAQSSQLATAGFTDVATSVDVLTTILNAYKMEADQTEKVASTLVKTQDLGKITVDDLGKVIGRVIPSAAAYGVNLDNIAAAYANMTAAGINAENTTTYLSTMLDELADSGSDVAAVLQEQTGKSFAELMAEGMSLGDVLNIIGSSVEYDNTQFSNLWSSATAGKAAISLFDGSADTFNQTLYEMANSSGTVAKNYEKMTAVSEYSSQRLEVASKNLSIAVGTQLNPVLDNLREAGAGVLEAAAQVVSENPALVSVIAGTVTALGLLAGGLSALMIVKAVTAAMAALNITLAANPIGLVAVAVAGLVAALATYAAQTESVQERVDQLTESSRKLSETLEEGSTAYGESVAGAEAAAVTVGHYIDRLEELEAQGLQTAAHQQEYSMTLEKINSIMPGINAELDAQTNLVKGGTEALRKQAEAWKQNAVAEAAYARYQDDIKAFADAEYELAKNQALLNMAEKEQERILKQLAAAEEKHAAAVAYQTYLNENATLSTEEFASEMDMMGRTFAELDEELATLHDQLAENADQQLVYQKAVDASGEAIEKNRTYVEASSEAYASMAEQAEDTSKNVADASGEMADATEDAANRMDAAYLEMYHSARDSLESQIGLFDDLSGKCEMSMDEMIENLRSQKVAFDNYATNIERAMERGIDRGLIQKLSDGSVESMQILEVLVNGTEEQVADLNDAFRDAGVSKDELAQSMVGLQLAVEEATANAAAAAEDGGIAVVDGLIYGIKLRRQAYMAAMGDLARSGQGEYGRVNQIYSPSRAYRKLASYDVEGLIVQYKADTPKLKAAAADMANAGYISAIRARQVAIPSLASAVSTRPSSGDNGQLLGLLQQILTGIKAGQRLVIYPDRWVGGTVGDYDAALGQRQILTERGAL